MRDVEIRATLLATLRAEHPDPVTDRIVPEMALCLGACRVDVGVVNGALSGFEIKSPRDNLARLPSQVSYYSQVLDFATVVLCDRYIVRVMKDLPAWWGVRRAAPTDAGVELY